MDIIIFLLHFPHFPFQMLDLSSQSTSGFSGVRSDLQAVNSILQDCKLAPGKTKNLSIMYFSVFFYRMFFELFCYFCFSYFFDKQKSNIFSTVGFIDAFTTEKTVQQDHGQRLFKVIKEKFSTNTFS
jgi:hypothetical protein